MSGEVLEEAYAIPVPFIEPYKITAEGDMTINYLGFTQPGKLYQLTGSELHCWIWIWIVGVNPAVPIGTVVTYACSSTHVFSHDWYARPSILITCQETGDFNVPELWPLCIERKFPGLHS